MNPESAQPKKVLIIEDDKLIATLYRNHLQGAGFKVEVVNDGPDGFYRIHETRFAALVLDLLLPNMSGLEILRKIRAQKQFQELPVFVLTNAFLGDLSREAQALGVACVLDKASTTPRVLADELRRVLGIPEAAASSTTTGAGGEDSAIKPEQDALQEIKSGISALRQGLQNLSKAREFSIRETFLLELLHLCHKITGRAAGIGMRRTAHLSAALEALLQQLQKRPAEVNASTLRTMAAVLDLLPELGQTDASTEEHFKISFNIMALDDEPISRRAVVNALERIGLRCIAVDSSEMALKLARENVFDLFILDIEMPGMNGLELCRELRSSTVNQKSPVIFVTSLGDFEARANAALSGGTDLLANPFLPIELGLKALIYIYKRNLQTPE